MVARRSYRNGHAEPEPLHVFVGTSAGDDAEACLVLEHTLRKNASGPVTIGWHHPAAVEGWSSEEWATPWTGYRWAVPSLCGWSGRAVYLDCPQVVIGDVVALAATSMPPKASVLIRHTGGTVRTGVMVWDCAAARSWVPPLNELRRELGVHQRLSMALAGGSALAGELPAGWDVRDVEFSDDPAQATGSVHYANAHMQPHQIYARRRLRAEGREHWFKGTRLPHFCPGIVTLWEAAYAEALAAGHSVNAYVPRREQNDRHPP